MRVGFQCAAVVMQTDAGNLRDQAISHAAGQVALDRVVLSVPAPAGNDVIAFVESFSRSLGISAGSFCMSLSMKTRISPDENRSGLNGRRLPALTAKRIIRKRPSSPARGFHLVRGSVRAAVIHKDDFRIGQAFQRFFRAEKDWGGSFSSL